MKITIFGLTLSSSWGNGHATPYRAILRALYKQGGRSVFCERDVPYYTAHRDFRISPYCDLKLYSCWENVKLEALRDVAGSDIVINASYCPEGARLCEEVLDVAGPLHVFYDLDTPITLNALAGRGSDYLRLDQIPQFDLICPSRVAVSCGSSSTISALSSPNRFMAAWTPTLTSEFRRVKISVVR